MWYIENFSVCDGKLFHQILNSRLCQFYWILFPIQILFKWPLLFSKLYNITITLNVVCQQIFKFFVGKWKSKYPFDPDFAFDFIHIDIEFFIFDNFAKITIFEISDCDLDNLIRCSNGRYFGKDNLKRNLDNGENVLNNFWGLIKFLNLRGPLNYFKHFEWICHWRIVNGFKLLGYRGPWKIAQELSVTNAIPIRNI